MLLPGRGAGGGGIMRYRQRGGSLINERGPGRLFCDLHLPRRVNRRQHEHQQHGVEAPGGERQHGTPLADVMDKGVTDRAIVARVVLSERGGAAEINRYRITSGG